MFLKILLIDNYDSFTYNLEHLFYKVHKKLKIDIIKNDKLEINSNSKYDAIVISPGPGNIQDTGKIAEFMKQTIIPNRIPTFGVCLGMQFIGTYFGMKLIKAKEQAHGRVFSIFHNNSNLFQSISNPFLGTRYNSLMLSGDSKEIEIVAKTDNMPMAIKHKHLPFIGVQYHPESFLSEYGVELIQNFLKIYVYR